MPAVGQDGGRVNGGLGADLSLLEHLIPRASAQGSWLSSALTNHGARGFSVHIQLPKAKVCSARCEVSSLGLAPSPSRSLREC